MKLKYQQGGMLPSYVVYQPIQASTQQTPEKQKTESKSNNKLDDELYKLLSSIDALPGDLNKASSELSFLFKKINNDSQFNSGDIERDYLHIIQKINLLKFNKDTFEKAREQSIKSGSINEPVIDSMGRTMVVSDNQFKWISPEEFAVNPEKYNLVTNAELLNYRAQGLGGLAFNDNVINTISNGISISQVTKYIQDIIKDLGSSINEEQSYLGVKSGNLLQGLKDYKEALQKSQKYDASVQDLYEVKLLTESQAEQAILALQYIYNTLPTNAKSLLKLKSNGEDSGAKMLIGTLINSSLKYKQEFSPKLVGGKSSDKTSNKSSDKTGDELSNPYLQLIREQGGISKTVVMVPDGTDIKLSTNGTWYAAIPKIDEETSVDNIFKSGLQGITLGTNNVLFGDQLLTSQQLQDVMFDNEGAAVVTLPIIKDTSGNIRVNLGIIEDYNSAMDEMKKYKHLTKEEQQEKLVELYKKYNLYELLDSTGKIDYSKTHQFLMFGAYAKEDIISNKKSKFIKKVENPSQQLEEKMKLALSNKVREYDIDVKDWDLFFYDDIYKANVFIPLTNNINAAVNAWGDKRKEAAVDKSEQQMQTFNKMKNMKPTNETK